MKKYFYKLFLISILLSASLNTASDAETIKFIGKKNSVLVYKAVYTSDNLSVKGRIYIPSNVCDKMPALVYNHDGVNGISSETSEFCINLSREGFIVLAPSYRGEDGSGGEIEIAKGEVNDSLSMIKLLDNFKNIFSGKIGMLGTSHGALISILAAERDPKILAVCEAYGVMDLNTWWYYLKNKNLLGNDGLTEKIYGNGPQEKPLSFKIRNALTQLENMNCPVLILQGKKDEIVPAEQAYIFEKALKENNKNYEIFVYPGVDHGFLIYAHSLKGFTTADKKAQKDAFKKIVDFFNKYLKLD
jgi:dipeptidyl aminopeptidase/acylaminoacyl peptidase